MPAAHPSTAHRTPHGGTPETMATQEDIATFSGFGSWMSTFTPAGQMSQKHHGNHVFELEANTAYELEAGTVYELPTGEGMSPPKPDAFKKYDHVPPPKPAPVPKLPPSPSPAPDPIHKVLPKEHGKRPGLTTEEKPDPMTHLRVKGLRAVGEQHRSHEEPLTMSTYSFLDDINTKIRSLGYKSVVGFLYKPDGYGRMPLSLPLSIPVGKNEPAWPILVTNGKSCHDPDVGLRINVHEPFSAYLSKLQLSARCAESKLLINNGDLKMEFHRTLRVPEDGCIHRLPRSFGLFPLQNLAAYAEKLQRSKNPSLLDMVQKSGVFLPMFQREAMRISFEAPARSEYIIRIFAGGVNAVSGRKWDAPPSLRCPSGSEKHRKEQDYILVPSQECLDGITVGEGLVRQFVAMPIGSGYSIEKQMTGREDVGGLQIEVTPTHPKLKLSIKDEEISNAVEVGGPQGEAVTPLYYDLQAGDEVMATRHGRGLPCMGSKIQRAQKKLLRELLPPHDRVTTAITALYDFRLQITIKGKLRKHTIETSEFSPFSTLKDVAARTTFRGKDLLEFEFWSGEKRIPLDTKLAESGVYEHPALDARKPHGGLCPYKHAAPHSRMSVPVDSMAPMSFDSHKPSRFSLHLPGRGRKSYATDVQSAGAYGSLCGYGLGYPPPGTAVIAEIAGEGRMGCSNLWRALSNIAAPPATFAAPLSPRPRDPPPDDEEQESWAMGIAPGGILRQEIQRDNDIHRATTLNRSATCLISVQLLNSVAYEAITGMLCPPTPITLQTYVAARIPWFDTYRNNTAATSGQANFRDIRSVGEMDGVKGVKDGVSVAESRNVACTVCKRSFCDCVVRPCNHAFCAACVWERMFAKNGCGGRVQGRCWECGTGIKGLVGFAAPMGLPGEEGIWPDAKVDVVVAKGGLGKFCFELE